MDLTTTKSLKLQLIIVRAQSGDDAGFRALYDRFCGMTLNYLTQIIGMKNAEDVQQQLWFKVYQELVNLSNPFSFKSWLMQIAHRTAMDFLRKEKRYVQKIQNIESEENSDLFNEKEKLCPELLEHLHLSLNKLGQQHREVLILFYWHELTCVEIANILQNSIGTVKSRLFHARQKLSLLFPELIENFNVQ